MKVINIYHFEDAKHKREWLDDILARLNEDFRSANIDLNDAIGNKWFKITEEPGGIKDLVLNAIADCDGLILLDVQLISHPTNHIYDKAAELIKEELSLTGQEKDGELSDAVFKIFYNSSKKEEWREEDYTLASLITALCLSRQTRLAFVSTAVYDRVEDLRIYLRNSELPDIPSILFPDGPKSNGPSQLRCDKAVADLKKLIQAVWLTPEWIKPEEFVKEVINIKKPHINPDDQKALELLCRFLRLTESEFFDNFSASASVIHHNLVEGFKSLAGARDYLGLRAAWLLSLGVYRNLFESEKWQEKWNPNEILIFKDETDYAIAYSTAKVGGSSEDEDSRIRRGETLLGYARLCESMFAHRKNKKTTNVQTVKLDEKGLVFSLSISFTELQKTICRVFRKGRGENLEMSADAHDTSTAILQFVLSSSFNITGAQAVGPAVAPLRIVRNLQGTDVKFIKE